MTEARLPTLFIPHGGGPCFFMDPPRHGPDPWKSMGDHLKGIAATIGRALQPLRDEDVLIVGSGLSFHNLRGFFTEDPRIAAEAEAFDQWLTRAVTDPDPTARDAALCQWVRAPGARTSHPREEHLLPLMVAAGAAGADAGMRTYSDHVFGKAVSSYRFG